jgi:glucose-fructose oxidoreductase
MKIRLIPAQKSLLSSDRSSETIVSRTLISRRAFNGGIGAMAFVAGTAGHGQPARPDQKLGIALVGLGTYSTNELAPALLETKSCYLAGVVTGSLEKGKKWAQDFRFPERNIFSYETMADLKNAPDIDIVYVVTPNALHAQHAIAAARAGKHVISEKPFTTSVADAEAVIAACRDAKVKLSIGYRLHFHPYYIELMRLTREKEFGNFTSARGEHAYQLSESAGWRLGKALGGGPLRDLGIYVIQAACMAAGDVASVSITAQQGPTTQPKLIVDVEESMAWTMTFANGLVCDGTTSYVTKRQQNDFRAEGPQGWIKIKNAFAYRDLEGVTSRNRLTYNPRPPVRLQALQMDDFARCIIEDRPSRVPGEMGLRDVRIIASIFEAAGTGERVQLKL